MTEQGSIIDAGALSNKPSSFRGHIVAIILLAAFPLLYFYRVLWLQTYTLFGNWDASIQSFAWYAKIARALQEGSFPYWDFYTDSGTYFTGELQTGAFYPPSWLFALVFNPADAAGFQFWAELFSVLHFSLGAVFAYLLLRAFKLGWLPAVIGAVLSCFFGAIAERPSSQPNIHAGMVYLPGVLYCALRAWQLQDKDKTLLAATLAGVLLGLSILAGHVYAYIHMSLLTFLLLFAICLNSERRDWAKVARILALMALCSLLLSAVQLVPVVEYFRRAFKWYGPGFTAYPHVVPFEEFSRWAFSSWETLLSWRCSTDCAENRTLYVGWTALPLAVVALAVNRTARRVVFPVILVILLIAMAGDNLLGQVLYRVPLLDNVRVPSRILFAFPLCMAILAGLGLQYLLDRTARRPVLRAGLVVLVLLGFTVDLVVQNRNWQVTGIPREAAVYDPARIYNDPAARWLQGQLAESLFRWGADPNELLPPNGGEFWGINSVRGHRSSMLRNYHGYAGRFEDSQGWMPRQGLKYLVKDIADPSLHEVFRTSDKFIYELPAALPLVHGMDGDSHFALPLTDIHWRTNSLQVKLDPEYSVPHGSRIFFGVTWYPGWRLMVDGVERELRKKTPADGAFMSAQLLPSDRVLEIRFFPRRQYLTWLSLLLLLGWLGFLGRRLRTRTRT